MIHHKAAHDCSARHREDFVATVKQRPWSQPFFITRTFQCRSRIGDVLVEGCEQFAAGLYFFETKRRSAWRRYVQFILFESVLDPTGNVAQMRCQTTERSRLRMRLPSELVFGNAVQRLARVGHFLIE